MPSGFNYRKNALLFYTLVNGYRKKQLKSQNGRPGSLVVGGENVLTGNVIFIIGWRMTASTLKDFFFACDSNTDCAEPICACYCVLYEDTRNHNPFS